MSIHSVSSLISYLMAFSSWRLVGLSKNFGLTAQKLSWNSWHRERATVHTSYMHYVMWWKILRRGSAHSWAAHSWAAAKYQNTQRLPTQFCLYLHRSPTAKVNADVLRKQENQWHSHTSGVRGVCTPCQENTFVTTFFGCTADMVGQLNGNGQKGMPQIDWPVENFWLRHWGKHFPAISAGRGKRGTWCLAVLSSVMSLWTAPRCDHAVSLQVTQTKLSLKP